MATTSGKPLTEPKLRDYLAEHLDLIEPGLTLVRKEYPVANALGASGSIDILARDSSGDLVVIELKRLDQVARQALHELEKYVGLLAADRGIRVDQLRCILLSTVWHELLVPFARFVTHADFHASGRLLQLGEDGLPTGSVPVELPELSAGLETCPVHFALLNADAVGRDADRQVVAEALSEFCVEDYITVDLEYTGEKTHVVHRFGHYVVFAEFSEALREYVRTRFAEDPDEEFDDVPWWFEQLVQQEVVRAAHANEVEVMRPERFGALDGWEIGDVVGHGRYDDELVWSEDQLLRAVAATGETYSMPFTRQVKVANKPAWARMRADLHRCLLGAGQWPEIVAGLLDEIEKHHDAELTVNAYVPLDILAGLEHLVRVGTSDYLPQLFMGWKTPDTGGLLGGILHWDGKTLVTSVDETLGATFDNFIEYVTARVAGGLWEFETELCARHGLRYDVIESRPGDDEGDIFRVHLDGDRLIRTRVEKDEPQSSDFIDAHEAYLRELARVFDDNTYRL